MRFTRSLLETMIIEGQTKEAVRTALERSPIDLFPAKKKTRSIPHPERRTNPKGNLYRIFDSIGRKKYIDWKDAEKIIKLANINTLQCCLTFQKFEKRIREL